MPYRLVLFPLLLLVQTVFAQSSPITVRSPRQAIDSLHTEEQVLAFVKSVAVNFKELHFHPHKPIYGIRDHEKKARDFGALPYEKVDLDNNGYTDLLFNGYEEHSSYSFPGTLVIFSFGGDSLRIEQFPKEIYFDFFAAKTVHIDGHVFLHALQVSRKSGEKWRPGSRRA